MRLHALLSWYDEPLSTLEDCVTSVAKAGVQSLVALDGAYCLFPDGKAASPSGQVVTLKTLCRKLGIDCSIVVPADLWVDEEAKRTALFALALEASEPGDWWLGMDADTVVVATPDDLVEQLGRADEDVARVTVRAPQDPKVAAAQATQDPWARTGHFPYRLLFRAQAIRCEENHAVYRRADGRNLWAPLSYGPELPCLDMPDLIIEHRDVARGLGRQARKAEYYARRG